VQVGSEVSVSSGITVDTGVRLLVVAGAEQLARRSIAMRNAPPADSTAQQELRVRRYGARRWRSGPPPRE
jgi:hypothetical protein